MKGYIYKLICPIDNNIKYVGQTSKELSERLRTHISKTKSKIERGLKLSKKEFWIKKLISYNLERNIIIEEIELCDIILLDDREIYWIYKFKNEGHKLTNMTDGGQPRVYKLGTMSDEHKLKISEGLKKLKTFQETVRSK